MDVRAENRGRPQQKALFPAAPVVGRNFLTPGHPGVRVRNVRGKSGLKSLCLCCFFFSDLRPRKGSQGLGGGSSGASERCSSFCNGEGKTRWATQRRLRGPIFRVFLNPWFGEPVVCTLDSRGFRNFRGFRDFRESSARLLVCSYLSCLWRFRRFRDFRRFRERRPARKP